MNIKKIIMGIVVIIVVVIGICLLAPSKETGAIRLGFIGALSGDGASYGESEKNATEIAVAEINEAGGIKGRIIEVIYEDGKCNAKDAMSAIQKLISVDKVKIILGGTCSSETLAISPIAEENKILLLSAFSSSPEITKAGDYIFRNSPSDSDVAVLDANTIASKYKKVAIISENTDYSQGVLKIMKEIFAKEGVSIISEEIYSGGTKDFRSALTKIKKTNPEVIYINPGTDSRAGGIITKQARELGINTPLHGNFSLATKDSFDAGGSYLNGVISNDVTGLSTKGVSLLEKYKTIYKKTPPVEFEMGSSYDRVYIIKQAIENVGVDSTKIKDYLYRMPKFDGTLGSYTFDKNGDVVGVGFINIVLQDGKKLPYNQ